MKYPLQLEDSQPERSLIAWLAVHGRELAAEPTAVDNSDGWLLAVWHKPNAEVEEAGVVCTDQELEEAKAEIGDGVSRWFRVRHGDVAQLVAGGLPALSEIR